MPKVKLKPLKDKISEIVIAKAFMRIPVFVSQGSTQELLKGFLLKETPSSVILCEWYYPDTQINNSRGFPGFYKEIEFKSRKTSSILPNIFKSDFSESELIDVIAELMNQNLPRIKQVNSLSDLETIINSYLKYSSLTWVGLANFAVWLSQLGKYDLALKYANISYAEAHELHPAYSPLTKLRSLLEQGVEPLDFLAYLKRETYEAANKAGLYKL